MRVDICRKSEQSRFLQQPVNRLLQTVCLVSGPSEYSDGGVVQYQLNDGKTAMSAGCETVRELRCVRSAQ